MSDPKGKEKSTRPEWECKHVWHYIDKNVLCLANWDGTSWEALSKHSYKDCPIWHKCTKKFKYNESSKAFFYRPLEQDYVDAALPTVNHGAAVTFRYYCKVLGVDEPSKGSSKPQDSDEEVAAAVAEPEKPVTPPQAVQPKVVPAAPKKPATPRGVSTPLVPITTSSPQASGSANPPSYQTQGQGSQQPPPASNPPAYSKPTATGSQTTPNPGKSSGPPPPPAGNLTMSGTAPTPSKKIDHVPSFAGEGSLRERAVRCEEFLKKCEVYFRLAGGYTEATDKAAYALYNCTEGAWKWAENYVDHIENAAISTYPDNGVDKDFIIPLRNWGELRKLFRTQWCSFDQGQAAVQEIRELQYKNDIADFAAKYRSMAAQTDWNDAARRDNLRDRLPSHFKTLISQQVAIPKDYNEFINFVIQIGQQHEQLAQGTPRSTQGPPRGNGGFRGRGRGYFGRGGMAQNPRGGFGGGRNFQGPRLSREDRNKYMQEGKCFQCGQTGHLSRNCPNTSGRSGQPSGTTTGAANPNAAGKAGGAAYGQEREEESEYEGLNFRGAWRNEKPDLPWRTPYREYENVTLPSTGGMGQGKG